MNKKFLNGDGMSAGPVLKSFSGLRLSACRVLIGFGGHFNSVGVILLADIQIEW
jgi:hypothetical protein